MDGTQYTVTLDEFKLFHGIDRTLYAVLVRDLGRDTLECLHIMGLWLWLERGGFCNFVSKILSLPPFLINELADEAVICLKCINTQLSEVAEIPLTHSLAKKDISLQFFQENRRTARHEIQSLITGVCIPSLSDIMEKTLHNESPTHSQIMLLSHAASTTSPLNQIPAGSFVDSSSMISNLRTAANTKARANETSRNERTMFVTFSKGYPVTETEVRQFFTRLFGNCIESFHMQEVVSPNEQALYAKIVFLRSSFIRAILSGVSKAKFTINGKHVWMRKFVPKNERPLPMYL
ncbi:uncharacterized protein LOC105173679 [Sesamum indicum]|uniref:Uncharacterized protein LOC105173679 n=1 Tax=Sesamum indicum TaxID=4182 RepID=A0A6I9UHV1_SESIN|nr:uncharacterized protein LOC105173679 [Sesamum indicum]